MLIVLVKFKVPLQDAPLFRKKLIANAQTSLTESECHRFDLGETFLSASQEYEYVLYEEYSDQAAFDYHLTTSHFLSFNEETAQMVSNKEISLYQSIN